MPAADGHERLVTQSLLPDQRHVASEAQAISTRAQSTRSPRTPRANAWFLMAPLTVPAARAVFHAGGRKAEIGDLGVPAPAARGGSPVMASSKRC
jgi:hypothetical protein